LFQFVIDIAKGELEDRRSWQRVSLTKSY